MRTMIDAVLILVGLGAFLAYEQGFLVVQVVTR